MKIYRKHYYHDGVFILPSTKTYVPNTFIVLRYQANLVGKTERETGVGKLGWHGNSTGFDRKNVFFLFCVTKEKRKISLFIDVQLNNLFYER